jgi:prophage regulatory protein
MRMLRIKQIIAMMGLSRMTIYRLERAGLFPTRRKLGKNSVAWIDDDIASWIAARPSGVVAPRGTAPQRALF